MDKNTEERLKLHTAGATVITTSPFDDLVSHVNSKELEQEFVKKWVIPFYMTIDRYHELSWVDKIKEIKPQITPEITLQLLGDFNWRTRLVGAYFSAVKGFEEQVDSIGTHFLKSEVCCVGHIYALVLAFFNSEKAIQYLEDYLNYYLQKPGLYFDQESALQALFYLDTVNKTSKAKKHFLDWEKLKIARLGFSKTQMDISTNENNAKSELVEDYLKQLSKNSVDLNIDISFFEEKIKIVNELNQY
ncbi:hypothetical protein FIA58_017680 [Flavobacterium jejuense]|uniref:Uncharacterized protein n=1 Tax=Flavobacterium jejuense TaxID=1544455 RepID=A0ABX0IXG7_9FLAO|nr:DUF6000 family protein [Flavobacterium jejuense]NHN27514.1 hypothetical protein [Flavobacterium jejuense]